MVVIIYTYDMMIIYDMYRYESYDTAYKVVTQAQLDARNGISIRWLYALLLLINTIN